MSAPRVTERNERFLQLYAGSGKPSESYAEVYSTANCLPTTIARNVHRLLEKPHIKARLEEVLTARAADLAERTGINTAWVVGHSVELVERCMQAVEVLDRKGEPVGEWTFDSAGANKALALIANHTGGFDKNSPKPEAGGPGAIPLRDAFPKLPLKQQRALLEEALQQVNEADSEVIEAKASDPRP